MNPRNEQKQKDVNRKKKTKKDAKENKREDRQLTNFPCEHLKD